MNNIIKITEDVYIKNGNENIILEKGDKIKILEATYVCQKCGYETNDYGNSICARCGATLDVMGTYKEEKNENNIKEAVDIKKVIKDLQGNFAKDNEAQMKGIQLLKGLATSDDPLSNEFMKALDKETTRISKEVLSDNKEESKRIKNNE